MDLLDSLEIRWFLASDHPSLTVAQKWFASAALDGNRTDDYLLTGRNDLGFKARVVENQPTKLETKYLVGSLGVTQVAPGTVGRLERWRKLSLPLSDPRLKKDGDWRTVKKNRRVRKFAFDGGGALEVPVESHPVAGCGIELTELRVDGNDNVSAPTWTIGLEAFGPELNLLEIFWATCRATLGDALKLELGGELSMSYPQWLASTRSQDR